MAKRSAMTSAPIWTRPAPGARQPRLTREQIAQAALAIADAEGFDAVSMRRVAAELGAGTMTLYYYVKTKDDLIALMEDAIMAEVLVPANRLPRGWRAGLAAIARTTRDVFLRHRWALHNLQGVRPGPNGMRHVEQSLAVVAELPGDTMMKLRILSLVDDYVFGHVLRVSEIHAHPADPKVLKLVADFVGDQLASGDYPHMKAMFGGHDVTAVFSQVVRWMTDDARFEAGLTAMLDGLERQIRGAARPKPRRARKRRSSDT
jgi:AcrR family transcriptional regulator